MNILHFSDCFCESVGDEIRFEEKKGEKEYCLVTRKVHLHNGTVLREEVKVKRSDKGCALAALKLLR